MSNDTRWAVVSAVTIHAFYLVCPPAQSYLLAGMWAVIALWLARGLK